MRAAWVCPVRAVFALTALTRGPSRLTANPFSSSATSLSLIPASPSIRASPSSPATVTRRRTDANPQGSKSHFLNAVISLFGRLSSDLSPSPVPPCVRLLYASFFVSFLHSTTPPLPPPH